MKIGDRVRVLRSVPNGSFGGMTGTITGRFAEGRLGRVAWSVLLDDDYSPTHGFYEDGLELLEEKDNKAIVLEYAQRNRDAMLDEIDLFRHDAEAGTLGDFSELKFLANLLQALIKE